MYSHLFFVFVLVSVFNLYYTIDWFYSFSDGSVQVLLRIIIDGLVIWVTILLNQIYMFVILKKDNEWYKMI